MHLLQVFHSGTKQDAAGQVVSAGGRVLAVTAMADEQQQAQHYAYKVLLLMVTSCTMYLTRYTYVSLRIVLVIEDQSRLLNV